MSKFVIIITAVFLSIAVFVLVGIFGDFSQRIEVVSNKDAGNANVDFDSDGILDANYNCPVDFNPDQNDTDNDNIGDECEPKY